MPIAHAEQSATSHAGGPFGLGVILGSPTGLSGKYWLSRETALDFAVGGALVDGGLHIHADHLWHKELFKTKEKSLHFPFYIGVGPFLRTNVGKNNQLGVGARVPFGASFTKSDLPLDVFLEIAPALRILEKPGFGFQVGLGARYYFES